MRVLFGFVFILVSSSVQASASEVLWGSVSRRLVHLAQENPRAALTAIHEAGHIVVNQHLATGMEVSTLDLDRMSRGFGATRFELSEEALSKLALGSLPHRLAIRRVAVLLAGDLSERAFLLSVLQERRLGPMALKALRSESASESDRAQAARILRRAVGFSPSRVLERRAEKMASMIILRHQQEIEMKATWILEQYGRRGRSCADQIRFLFVRRMPPQGR
jgi:hypothetical protein